MRTATADRSRLSFGTRIFLLVAAGIAFLMPAPVVHHEASVEINAGREKVWRTIGKPELLIIAGYEMRVLVEPVSPTSSRLTISIDYELPRAGIWRALGWALAGAYSRWCLTSMVEGSKRDLEANRASP